ncbi:MAG TPA: GlsB/YeaQ/YmgE family stress response membrane protein [Candidatus Limnocylindria bacterium]|nr:GlsB/YeaQ/YmgE family stress response membrane protein [Candidatus Limnocylindria bacterium]
MLVTIIAWVVLGAIAGYIAGLLVKGDERFGIMGHIVLGIVGAFVGGFLADALGFGKGAAGGGDVVNVYSIIIAVIGAVIAVILFNMLTRRSRV